jgi:predicted NBD/HSP70 family sugar kinase
MTVTLPTQPVTGDQRLVKSINRMALLRLLRDEPGLSRADLADRSGLTRSTVSLLSKELLEEGWFMEDGATATGSLGRRPIPMRVDGRRLALIGAELTPDTLRVAATSVQGEVLEVSQAALRHPDPDPACHQLIEMVSAMARRWVGEGREILGIGVGLPGAVDTNSGLLLFAPNIGWHRIAVGARLREELQAVGLGQIPVYCQNEADIAAVGETEFSPRPIADPLVFVSCGVGLGSGIVLGRMLFTGATGAGGEIGHTTLHIGGRLCSCGRRGCAEAYVGLRVIASEAGFVDHTGAIDRVGLKAAMVGRHAKARAAFESAGESLGVLLQNVWTTFDPKAIVLGGEAVSMGGGIYVDAALKVLHDYAKAAGAEAPTVRLARYTELATAVGGAGYALYSLMNPYLSLQQSNN